MRTFHAGGVASGSDITQGLPRVEELFEARRPKGLAIISEIGGKITVTESKRKREKLQLPMTRQVKLRLIQFHTVQVLKFMTVTLLRRVTNLQWVL